MFAAALLVQLVVLYWPSPPGGPGIPGLDKLVHAGVFLAPALAGVLAGIRPAWLGAALVAHAVASELVQQWLLPERSGDVWDAVADVVGVALGIALGLLVRRGATRRQAPR
ncbi:hypothetical protein ABA31_03960 [Agrococcus baldri]|uniref:VanZ like family protein n=1 Tax=Agrococcus baldri TaxID=153730 RepID=A0AA87REM0_9MICO|nr:hypothetical protein ABA31_03960 [Agrococcus baldri]